jgi:hypothetical protein
MPQLRQLARRLRVNAFAHLSMHSPARRRVSRSPGGGGRGGGGGGGGDGGMDGDSLSSCCAALFGRFCGGGSADRIDGRGLALALRPFGVGRADRKDTLAGAEAEGLKLSAVLRAMRGCGAAGGGAGGCAASLGGGVAREQFVAFVLAYGSGGGSCRGAVELAAASSVVTSLRGGGASSSAGATTTPAAAASVAFVPCSAATLRRRVEAGPNPWRVPEQTGTMRRRLAKQLQMRSRKVGLDFRALFRRSFAVAAAAAAAGGAPSALPNGGGGCGGGGGGSDDNGGVLGYAAFAAAVRGLFSGSGGGDSNLSSAEVDLMIAGMDTSGRGYVDIDDFLDFLHNA